jgi:hypothetical protein
MGQAVAFDMTSTRTLAVFSISDFFSVGWTRKARLVSPSSRATGSRCFGCKPAFTNAFSR